MKMFSVLASSWFSSFTCSRLLCCREFGSVRVSFWVMLFESEGISYHYDEKQTAVIFPACPKRLMVNAH